MSVPDFIFEGRWAGRRGWYVVRPGADIASVRREWDAMALTTERPRWQRRVRFVVLWLAFLVPTAMAAVLASLVSAWGFPFDVLAGVGAVAAVAGGIWLAIALSGRIWPPPEPGLPFAGVTEDLELVQPELAEWVNVQRGASWSAVWGVAETMAPLRHREVL